MLQTVHTLFTRKPRYVQLTQYDLNGIAASAWQRVQSRTLAERSLEHQYPHLFIDETKETEMREVARTTEEVANQAISATPQLLTAKEAFQAEAPILNVSAARGSTVTVMEQMATADLVEEETREEMTIYAEQQHRIIELQRQIAGLRSTAPATDQEIREVVIL